MNEILVIVMAKKYRHNNIILLLERVQSQSLNNIYTKAINTKANNIIIKEIGFIEHLESFILLVFKVVKQYSKIAKKNICCILSDIYYVFLF